MRAHRVRRAGPEQGRECLSGCQMRGGCHLTETILELWSRRFVAGHRRQRAVRAAE